MAGTHGCADRARRGPGLAAADLEHAFERFWRAPDAADRPGSGLGLAIVRATAERPRRDRHGGGIDDGHQPAGGDAAGIQEGFRDKRPS
jgi:two-component system sensor histidine kinase MprB